MTTYSKYTVQIPVHVETMIVYLPMFITFRHGRMTFTTPTDAVKVLQR